MARLTIYRSDDTGAPTLSGTAGSLIALLQACLIDGYSTALTSITRSGSVATVTTPTNHHLYSGMSITIAGANESDYNGTFTITVTSAVQFTYTVGGSPSTPATGSITYKKIGAGWTKPYTGTNKAAFQQGSGSNSNLIRVDDNGPGAGTFKEARITGYETMSSVDVGTREYPIASQGILAGTVAAWAVRKSLTADATARDWVIAADARTFYCFIKSEVAVAGSGVYYGWGFGEIYGLMAGDLYKQFIHGRNAENIGSSSTDTFDKVCGTITGAGGVIQGFTMDRGHNGTGDPVNSGRHGDKAKSNGNPCVGQGAIAYTNPANGAFYMARVWVHDPTTTPAKNLRGRFRGYWQFLHAASNIQNLENLVGTGELSGKTFIMIKFGAGEGANNSCYAIETSDTVETN